MSLQTKGRALGEHGAAYIYIPNWDRFQHYHDRVNTRWIKLHIDVLLNDVWEIRPDDRCVLITIWMLVAKAGQGRVKADQRAILAHAKVPFGPRSRNLQRLEQAGYIILDSRAESANASHREEKSKNPPTPRTAGGLRSNGTNPRALKAKSEDQVAHQREVHRARCELDDLVQEKGEALGVPDFVDLYDRIRKPHIAEFVLSERADSV